MRKVIGPNEEKFVDSKFIISIRYWNSSFHVIILKYKNQVLPETRVTWQFLKSDLESSMKRRQSIIFLGITLISFWQWHQLRFHVTDNLYVCAACCDKQWTFASDILMCPMVVSNRPIFSGVIETGQSTKGCVTNNASCDRICAPKSRTRK